MPKKKRETTKSINAPLYTLSNEELETLTKNADDYFLGFRTGEILDLRRNIALFSQSNPFSDDATSKDIDESDRILSCFSSTCTSLPFMFLSLYGDTRGEKKTENPLSLYINIDDDTTLEQIKEGWAEIKYWRDYIRKVQGPKMAGSKAEFLFDLHTKNMEGIGYGSLAKELNQTLRSLLGLAASSKKWVGTFEKELRGFLTKKDGEGNKKTGPPSSTFFDIRRLFKISYNFHPDHRKIFLERTFKGSPVQCLNPIPEKNPYINYKSEALYILGNLGFPEGKREEHINTSIQNLIEGRTMKNLVTLNKVREALRWWREKYDYPSPEKTDQG